MPFCSDCKDKIINDIINNILSIRQYYQTLTDLINRIESEAEKQANSMETPLPGISLDESRHFWYYSYTTVKSEPFKFGYGLIALYLNSLNEYYYQTVMTNEFPNWGSEIDKRKERDDELFAFLNDNSGETHKNLIKPLRDLRNGFLHNHGCAKKEIIIVVSGQETIFNAGEKIDFSRIDWFSVSLAIECYLLDIIEFGTSACRRDHSGGD